MPALRILHTRRVVTRCSDRRHDRAGVVARERFARGLQIVIRTEEERLRIVFHPARVEAFHHGSQRLAASRESGTSRPRGTLHRFDLRRGNRRRTDHIWLLRPSGSSGSGRHPVRTTGPSRTAARAGVLLNTVGSPIGPTFAARPSPVAASKAVPTVNILGRAVSSRWRRLGGCSTRRCHRARFDLARTHSWAV